ALVARILVDPAALDEAAPAWRNDVESRDFSLPEVSMGARGGRMAFMVLNKKGVLAILPDLASKEATVVGRAGEVDWEAVLKDFRDQGIKGAKVLPRERR
ncbi:MAG: hypothetical protein ACYS47_08460, partial [Planctomycetota bacterium]